MKLGFRHYFTSTFIGLCTFCSPAFTSASCPSLTFQETLNSAIEHSLALKQADANIQMKLADCWQAGLRINPELIVELDNIGGKGGNYGFNAAGPVVAISQILELGNKRSAREKMAAAVVTIAIWDREILKQELLQKVTNLVITSIANTEKIKFLQMANDNATTSLNCIAEKIKNGKATPILLRQTELTLTTSKIIQRKAESDRASSLRQLALICGCCPSDIDELPYPFFDFDTPPPLDIYQCALVNNPEVAKFRSALYAAGENYHLQKANAVPNLEITAGVTRDNRHRQNSFLLEFNIEIPVFNRNQGNICRSSWESMSASYQLEEAQAKLEMACTSMHDQLLRSLETVNMLHNEALPAVSEILQAYENGCTEGKYEHLDILLAQSRHIELQLQLIDALTEFHQLKTDLHYLCGSCF